MSVSNPWPSPSLHPTHCQKLTLQNQDIQETEDYAQQNRFVNHHPWCCTAMDWSDSYKVGLLNYLCSLIAWEKLTICPCFAVFLISAISFFSWVWRLCLSRSISLMDLSSIRLFSRRSSARETHNQQRILYNKQRSTQANPTWGGFSMGTA